MAGGRVLFLLLIMTMMFIFLQYIIGLLGTSKFDLPASVGVLMGSASLIGGQGTAFAWGPTIESQTGFDSASEIGIAFATLGLVVAELMGRPIAKYPIDRNKPRSAVNSDPIVGLSYEAEKQNPGINHINIMRVLLAANVAIILGYILNELIAGQGIKLPLFVPCLLMAILLSNSIPVIFSNLPWPARTRSLAIISDYNLSIFLSLSLMSMKLWTLSGVVGPLLLALTMQAILAAVVILVGFFRLMGVDYSAAVLSAGFAGFTLGATSADISNVSSVSMP